jgi:hypothetical protein
MRCGLVVIDGDFQVVTALPLGIMMGDHGMKQYMLPIARPLQASNAVVDRQSIQELLLPCSLNEITRCLGPRWSPASI